MSGCWNSPGPEKRDLKNMKADCPRILLAGDRSSSGKTTIVAGLLSALQRRGLKVQPFKVAMDYIDPSYHTWITGRSCRNLDGYLMPAAAVAEIYAHAAQGADISVIEGVRGLYEGYEGDLGSTAQIAKMLRTPVIFVVDARSITIPCRTFVLDLSLDAASPVKLDAFTVSRTVSSDPNACTLHVRVQMLFSMDNQTFPAFCSAAVRRNQEY